MAFGIISWIVLSFVAGAVGDSRKIGFAGAFFLSLFFSPLIGLIIAFNSDKKIVPKKLSPTLIKLIKEGDILWKNNEIENAIEKYCVALKYTDKSPFTNYKLSRLYSLRKDNQNALKHLAFAIRDGFNDFENINTNKEFAELRNTEEYKQFVENQYRLPSNQSEKSIRVSRIEKLEKLNALFEKGVLTREEFDAEKSNILSDKG